MSIASVMLFHHLILLSLWCVYLLWRSLIWVSPLPVKKIATLYVNYISIKQGGGGDSRKIKWPHLPSHACCPCGICLFHSFTFNLCLPIYSGLLQATYHRMLLFYPLSQSLAFNWVIYTINSMFFRRTDPEAPLLGTWWEEPIHWKKPWCWERLKAKGEGQAEDEMVR